MSNSPWRQQNKDKVREHNHKYYQKNKRKAVEKAVKWRNTHPNQYKISQKNSCIKTSKTQKYRAYIKKY